MFATVLMLCRGRVIGLSPSLWLKTVKGSKPQDLVWTLTWQRNRSKETLGTAEIEKS